MRIDRADSEAELLGAPASSAEIVRVVAGDFEVRSEAAYYGPSYMIDYLWNDYKGIEIETVLINCHYPISPP